MDRCTKIITNNIHRDLNSKQINTKIISQIKTFITIKKIIRLTIRMTFKWKITTKKVKNINSKLTKFKKNMIFSIKFKINKNLITILFQLKSWTPKTNSKIIAIFKILKTIMSKMSKENTIIDFKKEVLIQAMKILAIHIMIMKKYRIYLFRN